MYSLASDIVTIFLAVSIFGGFLYGFYTGINAS